LIIVHELNFSQEIAPGQESNEDIVEKETNEVEDKVTDNEGVQTAEKDANEEVSGPNISQTPAMAAGFGFDASVTTAFPGIAFGGDFNQMQMMMAMQNGGMGPNGFGNFPMMGMLLH
jgi:hypothetical protein